MMARPYVYKPLENPEPSILEDDYRPFDSFSTRVIELEPAEDQGAELRCSIVPIDLSRLPHFEAISYVWGPPVFSHALLCGDASIAITKSLDAALRRFRLRDKPRRLWADAVCINQADLKELSQQVQRMSQIYSAARVILVWLGPGDGELDKCMDFLWGLSSSRHEACPTSDRADAIINEEMLRFFGYTDINAVKRFLSLPWFTRRWVVQEAVLRTDTQFFCGDIDITSHALHHAVFVLNMSTFDFDGPTLDHIRSLEWHSASLRYPEHHPYRGVLDLLVSFSNPVCSNDRDRIYAYLGLADDIRSPFSGATSTLESVPTIPVQIDYTAEASEVYVDFAERMLLNKPHLDLLHCSAAFRPPIGQLHAFAQSWVPDWRRPMRFMPFLNVPWFRAGCRDNVAKPFLNYPWCCVGGFEFDTVYVWYKVPGLSTSHKGESRIMPRVFQLCRAIGMSGRYLNGERVWQALSMTFVADHALNPVLRQHYIDPTKRYDGRRMKRDTRERDMHTLLDWWTKILPNSETGLKDEQLENTAQGEVDQLCQQHRDSLHRSSMTGSFYKTEESSKMWGPASSWERSGWHSRVEDELEPYHMERMMQLEKDIKKRNQKLLVDSKTAIHLGVHPDEADKEPEESLPPLDEAAVDCEWRHYNDGFLCLSPHERNQQRYAELAHRTLRGRAFFITSKGYMGVGPEDMTEQDSVVVLYGARTPFILRKTEKATQWHLVGDCYVHGIMNGEALDMKKKEHAFVLV